jgi:succinoglycan biosynthesis transport protein ExoP
MLKTAPKPQQSDDEGLRFGGTSGGTNLSDSVKSLTSLVRRRLPIFLVVIPCALTLGLLYLLTTPPSYTAVARMLIDTRKVPAFQQQQQTNGDSMIDTVAVATQVEILTSDNVSKAVIKDLKLTEDPEFVGPGGGLIGMLVKSIADLFDSGSSEAVSETQLKRRALAAFESRRKITRVPQTYAMEIKFRSHDPNKAAEIANAISDAYVVDQLEAKYQSTKRASKWLQDRIHDLRADALASVKALIDFKEKNNIVEASGKMMNEQQMSEVTSQLILAHAATAEAKARLDRIGKVMAEASPIPSFQR